MLEIGKCGTAKRLFTSLTKEVLRRNSYVSSARYCLILEQSHILNFPKSLQKPATLNPYCTVKHLNSSEESKGTLDKLSFESICAETLDSLSEYFEELIESTPHLKNADVTYSDGVLTVQLGKNYGTYVINRQTPNLQIWLSSPTSGPKRYDFVSGTWIYKHDQTTLHSLLDREIKEIANQEVQFAQRCMHAKTTS